MNLKMDKCIDSDNTIYTIDNYISAKKLDSAPNKIFCPYCDKPVYIKGENSPKVETHFSHLRNQTCIIKDLSYYFKQDSIAKTNDEIIELKTNILKYSYNIYQHLKTTFNITIPVYNFIKIFSNVLENKILSLQGVTLELIPYIFINIMGKFNSTVYIYTADPNRISGPTNSNIKNAILCILEVDSKIQKTYIPVDNDWLDNTNFDMPFNFFKELIDNEFFNSFNLSDSKEIELLKEILFKK